MMLFLLGILTGFILAIFIAVVLAYYRVMAESKIHSIEKQIELKGPRPQGFIIEPPEEAEEARLNIIAQNRAKGRATKFEELI